MREETEMQNFCRKASGILCFGCDFIIYALLVLVANCPLIEKIWNVKLKRIALSAHSYVGYVLLFSLNIHNIIMTHSVIKGLFNANDSSSIKLYSIWQNLKIFKNTVFIYSEVYQ